MSTPSPDTALIWQRAGEKLFQDSLVALSDAELNQPSALPGWSRAYVASHVGHNAQAIQVLVDNARTGAQRPMYVSDEQRAADIEAGGHWPPDRLRAFVAETSATLTAALEPLSRPDDLEAAGWSTTVRNRQGDLMTTTSIPWLRARETHIHVVDLGGRVTFADLAPDFLRDLIANLVATRSAGVTISAHITSTTPAPSGSNAADEWRLGPLDAAIPVEVSADLADLAAWLTGRACAPSPDVEIGPWL